MFWKRSDLSHQLYESVREWQAIAAHALADKEISERIGQQKAHDLAELARGAGTILIGRDGELQTTRSSNGLYFVPLHDAIPEDTTLTLGKKGRKVTSNVWPRADTVARHTHSKMTKGLPDTITVPVSSPELSTLSLKEAVIVHELTHARQYRTLEKIPNPVGPCDKVTREAEAYNDTFQILDRRWDGLLAPIPAINRDNHNMQVIIAGEDARTEERIEMLNTSEMAALCVRAVCRNVVHGYIPDGSTVPSDALVEEYVVLDLV